MKIYLVLLLLMSIISSAFSLSKFKLNKYDKFNRILIIVGFSFVLIVVGLDYFKLI